MVMELNNKLYKNIGIHVITTLFTVDKGIVKVLLVKRTNEPFNGYWALPGGAMYNNETLEDGAKRELKEKTGLENIKLELGNIFDDVNRSNLQRMIGVSFLGVINTKGIELQKETMKTSNADFFAIDKVPKLAYDHNLVIDKSLVILKEKILKSSILKDLLPEEFTLPELQKVYETLLNKELDRRNFRKKLLNDGIIWAVNKDAVFNGKKPAKLYCFKIEKNKCISNNTFYNQIVCV